MTETREEDMNTSAVRLREMSLKQKEATSRDRSPGGPIKSPFSSRLSSSNRDSGIGIDSPASVTGGAGHFLFDLEDSGNVDSEDVFREGIQSDHGSASLVESSTPVTRPIPIPRRQHNGRNTTAHRTLAHRNSTGMFGNFPGEASIQHRATQTPSPSSQVISEAVHWQLGSGDEHDFCSFSFEQPVHPTARGTAVAHLRECALQSSSYESNLPDLVPSVRTRPRARSECFDRRELERSVGQELQRLGDDFHSSYQDLAPIRNVAIREENSDLQPSSYPGAAPADRGLWVKLKSALSPGKEKVVSAEKDPNVDKAKKP